MNDDELERMLRTSQPYLDDGGFTARVVQALPPSRARPRGLVLGSGVVGAAVALVAGPGRELAPALLEGTFSWPTLAAVAATLLLFAVTAVSVALREAER